METAALFGVKNGHVQSAPREFDAAAAESG